MLNDLETELSKLYPTQAHARRIADYAGIPTVFVDFEEPVAIIWHQIVAQANARQMVNKLVDTALKDFPNSQVLQQVHGAFLYDPPANNNKSAEPMSDRWGGSYEDTARLRERVSVIETNLPLLRADIERQLKQLSDGQAANRRWTEEKFNELSLLIKATPIAPKPQNDRVFLAVMAIGLLVTVILLLVIAYWIYILNGGRIS